MGSNRPLAWTILALAVGLLCATWPLVIRRERRHLALTVRALAIPLAAFGAAVAWALAQTIPGVGPAAPAVWAAAGQVLDQAGLSTPVSPSLSVDPYATKVGVMRLLTYGGVFWLAVQHGRLSRRPFRVVEALSVIAIVYAGYGLLEYASGTETILSMPKWAYIGELTSTFVNRNSYATFAGLGVLCCVAAVAHRLEDRRPGLAPLLLHLRRRTALKAVGAIMVLMALFCTGSRAGIIASLLALASQGLFLWMLTGRLAPRRAAVVLLGWGGLIGVSAAWLLMMSDTFAANGFDRALVYRLTWSAVMERPWQGMGLGTFSAAFEALRTPVLVLPWREAHDTYLELMFELGIPAVAALLAAVVWAAAHLVRAVLRPGANGGLVALALAGTVLMATHSLVDFSAQMPAVTMFWLTLLGSGVAQTRVGRTSTGAPAAGAIESVPA
ncbi:O-antigen ligase family protein [Nitrospirillum iridis]|uniref:O-antigen ligase n=1 Tax=Nitrospirillum iridis TaxID=765888 RepID=A0A7X0EF63_9PROT|nr:O-antigen ligase family protein [Nitrospirillum iridis]MBB6253695.1 O-antigen ligase [Nitrospirillum iridis]